MQARKKKSSGKASAGPSVFAEERRHQRSLTRVRLITASSHNTFLRKVAGSSVWHKTSRQVVSVRWLSSLFLRGPTVPDDCPHRCSPAWTPDLFLTWLSYIEPLAARNVNPTIYAGVCTRYLRSCRCQSLKFAPWRYSIGCHHVGVCTRYLHSSRTQSLHFAPWRYRIDRDQTLIIIKDTSLLASASLTNQHNRTDSRSWGTE